MKTMRWGVRAALVLLLTGMSTVAVEAQQRRPGAGMRPQLERQVRQRFQELVRRDLGLEDAQVEELEAVNEEFRGARRELAERQRELRQRLTSSATLMSPDDALAVLDEVIAVRREETRLMEEEQSLLLEILSPPQLVRYYNLREQLSNRIRAMRERRPRG